jgi:L-2,4-diaminobutyrate decarboxylase
MSLEYFENLYDPAHLSEVMGHMGQALPKYLAECLNRASTEEAPSGSAGLKGTDFKDSMDEYLRYARRIHSPHYMGHQVPPVIPLAGVSEALAGLTNNGLAIAEMAPFGHVIEQAIVEALGEKIGWQKETMAGIATSGGTLANLTALLAARNSANPHAWEEGVGDPDHVIVASEASHYSISRAAGVAGLGTNRVVPSPLDESGRMDPIELVETLEQLRRAGLKAICIVASAPSTPEGAIDPLQEIGEIAREQGIWYHVDAVHGATALFSGTYSKDLQGIELADSVSWDAHKMMHVPSLSTYLLYREKANSFLPFKQKASYLFEDGAEDSQWRDGAHRTFECTKRVTSLPLWMIWRHYGAELFENLVDRCYGLTRTFHGMLLEHPGFEPVHSPMTNIQAFRMVGDLGELGDQFHRDLRQQIIAQGQFYITATDTRDLHCLRLTLINPLTTESHLQELLATLLKTGAELRKP